MLWYLLLFPCAAILWMFLADALGAVREQSLEETDYRRKRDADPVTAIPAAKNENTSCLHGCGTGEENTNEPQRTV